MVMRCQSIALHLILPIKVVYSLHVYTIETLRISWAGTFNYPPPPPSDTISLTTVIIIIIILVHQHIISTLT